MKRSEAIKKMKKYIMESGLLQDYTDYHVADHMEGLLRFIEKEIGMLAPVSYKSVPDNTPRVIGKLGDHDLISAAQYYKQVAVSEWESEE